MDGGSGLIIVVVVIVVVQSRLVPFLYTASKMR